MLNLVAAGLTYAVPLGGNDVAAATNLFSYVTADSAASAIAAAVGAVPQISNATVIAQL